MRKNATNDNESKLITTRKIIMTISVMILMQRVADSNKVGMIIINFTNKMKKREK